MPTPPTVDEVMTYLGLATNDPKRSKVQEAYDAEKAAQAKAVRFPPDPAPPAAALPYPKDLAEALKRRVAANLARRGIPLGAQVSMGDGTSATIRVGSDVEYRRLEAPHRRTRGMVA
jgi:hypothetical protein